MTELANFCNFFVEFRGANIGMFQATNICYAFHCYNDTIVVYVVAADHLRNLDVYEVVVPRRVHIQSSSSSSLSSMSSTSVFGRRKRSSGNYDGSSRVYELSAFGRRMSLRLRLSPRSVVSPSFVVQHLADNETWLATYDRNSSAAGRWRCFHEGHVDGDPQSIVVVSTCSHLVREITLFPLSWLKQI